MRTFAASLAAVALAGSAAAQDTAPPPPAKAKVVEGVTVTGKRAPAKPCSARDADCLATVIAELKTRYPEKLDVWCMQQTNIAMDRNVHADWYSAGGLPAPTGAYGTSKVVREACAKDGK